MAKPKRLKRRSLDLQSLVKNVGEGNSIFGVFQGQDEFVSPSTGEILPIIGLLPHDGKEVAENPVWYWLPAGLMTALKTAKVSAGDKIEIEVGEEIPHPKHADQTIRKFNVYEAEF